MEEEEKPEYKRVIKRFELVRHTHKIEPKALKGILVAGHGLREVKIDLDRWLKEKKKEGFEIRETPEGIELEREIPAKERIFIGKEAIELVEKKKKEVEETI